MQHRLAYIVFLDSRGPVDPGYGIPERPGYGGPVDPGYGQGVQVPVDPGYGQGHVPPPRPSHPIHFPPVTPDNTLPGTPPTISLPIILPDHGTLPIGPEQKFELKYSALYGWVLVPVDWDEETAEPK